MDVREKLVELHRKATAKYYWVDNSHEAIVDDLIDHGVTVQEWISVNDRLPEESGDYLVILDWGTMCVLEFSKVHQAFNASDSIPNDSEIFCTHWMLRPQPPKGE